MSQALPANDTKNANAPQNIIRNLVSDMEKGRIGVLTNHNDITKEPQYAARLTQRLLQIFRKCAEGAMNDPKSGIKKDTQFLDMIDRNSKNIVTASQKEHQEEQLNAQAVLNANTAAQKINEKINNYRGKNVAVQPAPDQRSDRERDSRFNQKVLGKLTEQLGDLNAKHRTGVGGSSAEHDRLKRQVANLQTVLDPHEVNYSTERKAQALKAAKQAAEEYIVAKNHQHGVRSDDPNEVAVPGTGMGKKRYSAAKAILAICDKELQRMKAMGQVDAIDNRDIPQANAEQANAAQAEPLDPGNDLRYNQNMLKGMAEKKELGNDVGLTDPEFNCLAHILAFNPAYPNPQVNQPEDKLSLEQNGQRKELTREEYHKALPTELLMDPVFRRMRLGCNTAKKYTDLVKKATGFNGKQLIDEYAKVKQAMKNEQSIQNNKVEPKKEKKPNMHAGKN